MKGQLLVPAAYTLKRNPPIIIGYEAGEAHCGSGIYEEEISCPLPVFEPPFFGFSTRGMFRVLPGTILALRQNLYLSGKFFLSLK